jgi:hypothetical protein
LPFKTSVLGVDVIVEDIDLMDDGSILAICARGPVRQAIRVVPPSAGPQKAPMVSARASA